MSLNNYLNNYLTIIIANFRNVTNNIIGYLNIISMNINEKTFALMLPNNIKVFSGSY